MAESQNFAFVNKSFARDVDISIRLYESYEKFVIPAGQPFYVIIPQHDLPLFEQAFLNAKTSGTIKSFPIIITDEDLFKRCGVYHKTIKMGGWMQQQVAKMCFSKMELAKNYMTIDSDTYFTKPFPTDVLFENGVIKTYSSEKFQTKTDFTKSSPDIVSPFSKIKEVLGDDSLRYNNFVAGFGLWSSEILDQLWLFTKDHNGYDFADLITTSPYEMQWYGTFLFIHNRKQFFPISDVFTPIDNNLSHYYNKCFPTEGAPWHYGISLHHATGGYYINQCNKWRTFVKMSVRRIKDYISRTKQKLTASAAFNIH